MNILSKNMFVRLAGLMFAIVCVVSLVVLRLDNNEKKAQAEILRVQVEEMQTYVDSLQTDIDKPFDDEYVADIAHGELGLRYPQEVVYYSDGEG